MTEDKLIDQPLAEVRSQKIIFVHLLNDYSGSPRVLSQIIDATMANKDVTEVELYLGSDGAGFLSNKDCVTYTYFYRRSSKTLLTLIFFLLSQIALFYKLLRYRKEDVCFYINTMLPFGAALAGKLMGKETFYHIHETSLRPAIFKSFLRWIVNRTASTVIYVSEYLRLKEPFKIDDQKVIYNCLSRDFSQAASTNTYFFDSKTFNVLMVCSLKSYKGVNEFVNIAEMFTHRSDMSFRLVLNANEQEIDEFFLGVRIPENLSIFPFQPDLKKFYSEANLVLNLSKTDQWVETFGLTILEAMSYGIPTIVPPIGGPIELVRNNQDGYLIASSDTKGLYSRILSLSDDRNLCLDLSRSARKQSLKFNEDVFRKALKNIFLV